MWSRSATRPSETSIMAVAPASRATAPAAKAGRGRACALTRSRSASAHGSRPDGPGGPDSLSSRSPAAAPPRRPVTQMVSPGWAPLRNTGGPLTHPVTATLTTNSGPAAEVASDNRAAIGPRSLEDPLVERAQLVGGSADHADQRVAGDTSHGRDVAQVDRHRLPAEVRQRGERQVGVDAGHHRVCRQKQATAPWSAPGLRLVTQ